MKKDKALLHTIVFLGDDDKEDSVVAEILEHDERGVRYRLNKSERYESIFIPAHRLVKIKEPKEDKQ